MKRIVIIGAGPAGLTAGYELLTKSNEYEVIILEATKDLGGISKTVNYNGNRMDMGGHRFFSKDQKVLDWWNKILPVQGKNSIDDELLGREKQISPGGPDPNKVDDVMLLRNRISRICYHEKFFDYPINLKWKTIKNLGFITTVKAGCSYIKACVFRKKETSLENFYINRFGKVFYKIFFEKYTEKIWGKHPRNISADWGAQRVRVLSLRKMIKNIYRKKIIAKKRYHTRLLNNKERALNTRSVETSLIEEFQYPKYGPGQLWEKVANDFEKSGGKIYRNSEVIGIKAGDAKVESVTYQNNGEIKVLEADIFISSMSLKELINGMNDVPQNVKDVAKGLPYRDFVTIGLLVDQLNIKNETSIRTFSNIIPDCWIYVQDTGVHLGRIQIFNNWSPYLVKDPEKTVWIGLEYFCNETDDFYNSSEENCVKMAVEELIKMKLITRDTKILDAHRERVKKAYPAYFKTYNRLDEIKNYLNKYDNLYCVGRNGQHRYNNMDHSMITSFRTVENILSGNYTKKDIWNVNTEESYHEEKEKEFV